MLRSILFILVISFLPWADNAAILPKDGENIYCTSVYLQEDLQPGTVNYELTIYADSLGNNKTFFLQRNSNLPAFHVEQLGWDTKYFWSVKAYDKDNNIIHESRRHYFHVRDVVVSFPNAQELFLEIKTNKTDKNAGGLIAIDHMRGFYNRQGVAVWTIPNIPGSVTNETQFRDIKLTEDNSVTFLTETSAIEMDLDGTILWKAPSTFIFENDTIAYHHEFEKTKRGTYLVLGTRIVKRPLLGDYKQEQLQYSASVSYEGKKVYKETQMTVLLEFDKQGKLIWFWDSDSYITNEDLVYKKYKNGLPNFLSHANAFSESSDGKNIYISFRDLSRIVKIDKSNKKVVKVYGEKYPTGGGEFVTSAFRRQHDGTLTNRGTLLVFNNGEITNDEDSPVSSFIEVKENPIAGESAVVWEFPMNFEKQMSTFSSGGGNITELPNSNFLLCSGSLNRFVEVTRDKEIVWDAVPMMIHKGHHEPQPFPQYRCSWIPSLKDYHFIATIADSSQSGTIDLSIANTGSGDDFYTIEVLANGKRLYKTLTTSISTDTRIEQILPIKLFHYHATGNFIIRVTSSHGKHVSQVIPGTEAFSHIQHK